jgi:hypothetical protein
MAGLDKYDSVADLGAGNFGVAKLMRHKANGELVAIKFIERGDKVGFAFLGVRGVVSQLDAV